MAAHSSVLAWRIPGTEEPGGLPSMGSHRVRHDWSNLAAAVSYCRLKGVFLYGSAVDLIWMQITFFPQGVLAAITMVRGGPGTRGWSKSWVWDGTAPCSVAITTVLGQGLTPSRWIRSKLALFPFCVFLPLHTRGQLPQGRQCWSKGALAYKSPVSFITDHCP